MTAPHLRRLAAALLAGLLLVPVLRTAAADAGGGDTGGHLTLSGVVRAKDGRGIPNAVVDLDTTGGTTDATGHYVASGVPDGVQGITIDATCFARKTTSLTFTGNLTKDFTLDRNHDAFGHTCFERPAAAPTPTDVVPLTGDDASLTVPLPFAFPFYGTPQQQAIVSTNGYLTFSPRGEGTEDFRNGPLLDPKTPTNGIFAFWDDLVIDGPAQVRSASFGKAPSRLFQLEWSRARIIGTESRITVDLLLTEGGQIEVRWEPEFIDVRTEGESATIGIRDAVAGASGQAVQALFDTPLLTPGRAIDFVVNHAPVAHAGPDRTITSGAGFTLDGSGSTDPDGGEAPVLTWTQTAGPTTTIKTPHQAKTQVVGVKGPKTLTFQLKAVDRLGLVSTDRVTIKVKAPA